jgi:hypothetical protein
MTTTEHLQKIKTKCQQLLSKYPPCESTAGWRCTIVAINAIPWLDIDSQEHLTGNMISSWPAELLD